MKKKLAIVFAVAAAAALIYRSVRPKVQGEEEQDHPPVLRDLRDEAPEASEAPAHQSR